MSLLFISRKNIHARYYKKIADRLEQPAQVHVMGKPMWRAVNFLHQAFQQPMDGIIQTQYKRKVAKQADLWRKPWVAKSYTAMLSVIERLRLAKYLALLEQEKPSRVVLWNGKKLPNQTVVLAAQLSGIPLYFYENGLLPGTTSLDPVGVNQAASVPKTREFYFSPQVESLPEFHSPALVARQAHKKRRSGQEIDLPERYVFVPFQVPHDTQVVCYSPWIDSMEALYQAVMQAVKELNDPELKVVFKEHPSWYKHYSHLYHKDSQALFANHNATEQLIDNAEAVITINSTVGLEALQLDKRVITLGQACYNIEGLVMTADGPQALTERIQALGSWQPDHRLRNNFFRYLQHVYAIPGNWAACPNNHIQAVRTRLQHSDTFSSFLASQQA